ncbi:MAG: phytanoyl-CoA dioxygenase family protein [Planctomycetes bacterium]|nr:phytanoyl-CoA dioxygenase family protein [Planctomycetota bacterium]
MATSPFPGATPPNDRETFFFDLHGFVILRGALSSAEVAACNDVMDDLQHLKTGEWAGWVQAHTYGGKEGLNLQQIYEAGEPFERLIDHPAWIEKVRTLLGGEGTFDYHHGPLFIDECFANIRGPADAIGMHSGGHQGTLRTQFLVKDRRFHCGQVNVLVAHRDIGPGDGATMVVPASHKANFYHPDFDHAGMAIGQTRSMDGVEGAIEVHLRAGDALVFVDAIIHGSAARVNPGQRRISVYRYGPSWGNFRHGYRPSPELLARLSPARRGIVQPMDPVLPPCAVALA